MKHRLQCITTLLILYCIIAHPLSAKNHWDYVTIGNLCYELYDDYTACVTGIAYGANANISSCVIRASIDIEHGDSKITFRVNSIGRGAFYFKSSLNSITIPETVIHIWPEAFRGCTGLRSLKIPNSVVIIDEAAFSLCTGLSSVQFGNSLTTIGEGAFIGCTGLTNLEIPNSVKTIGSSAFSGCTGLTSITLGNSLTEIGVAAFRDCKGLTIVEIPNSVKTIGHYAFDNCSKLFSLTISDSVEYIGIEAFNRCTALNSVIIGRSVTHIDRDAFGGEHGKCENLKRVYINDLSAWCNINFESYKSNPTYFSHSLCLNESEITALSIPNSITTIKKYAFINCEKFSSALIGNQVTSIEDRAFCECRNLKSVGFPNSLLTIGLYSFSGCRTLQSVIIPNSVTTIEEGAFYSCENLISLTIGSGVGKIGENAFWDGNYLKNIYSKNTTPPLAYQDSFNNYGAYCTLHVPIGCSEVYRKTSPWSAYFIEEFDAAGVEDVAADGTDAPTEYYRLDGVKAGCGTEGLTPGIYIKRQGSKTEKVAIH